MISVNEKTTGECLRNNWNSISSSSGDERELRIWMQNNFSQRGVFDVEFYIKRLWNEEVEIW